MTDICLKLRHNNVVSSYYLPIVSYSLFLLSERLQQKSRRALLPIYTLAHYLFNPFPSITNSFMCVFLYPILPSYNWLSSPPRTLSFTNILFFHKLFTLLSFQITKLFHFHPFHITFAQGPMKHLSYKLSLLSSFHLVMPHVHLKQLISTARTFDCNC